MTADATHADTITEGGLMTVDQAAAFLAVEEHLPSLLDILLAQTQRSHEEQLRAARLEESARIARDSGASLSATDSPWHTGHAS